MAAHDGAAVRRVLEQYDVQLVDQFLAMTAACAILSYSIYTVSPDTVQLHGTDKLVYTVPFFVYGVFRYLFLVHKRGAGGSPEKVLLSDPPLMIDIAICIAIAVWALYL